MTWRELIEAYFAAEIVDARRSFEEPPSAHEQFLNEHATDEMIQAMSTSRKQFETELQKGPLPAELYKLISQDDDSLIAEVEANPSGNYPSMRTRFRLIFDRGRWLLGDYFWQCTCTNGVCHICDGTGLCGVCGDTDGRGCELCENSGSCRLCEGNKLCRVCKDSDLPGWNGIGT